MRLRIALALFTLTASQGLADEAVTYKGTIGRIPVILEMGVPDQGSDFAARYAYLLKGVDIPLHGKVAGDGSFAIEEEAPCDEKTCRKADGDFVETAPVGADWMLRSEKDGARLKGSWKDRKSGKLLPVALERVGSRELDGAANSLDYLDPMSGSEDEKFTPDMLPYDFLKFDYPIKHGEETYFQGATIRLDSDPRTGTAYPFIVKLPGTDTAAINAYLRQRWLRVQFNPYYCLSTAYLGLGWSGSGGQGTTGMEDGSSVTLEYLSPRLLGLVENGSSYCGGAHPNHFENRHFADVRTGDPVVAERLLKGFIAKDIDGQRIDPATLNKDDYVKYGPDEALMNFVNDRRDKSDASLETDCGMNDLVASNLGVYFTKTELVFYLKDLPYVNFACGADLVRVPLKDARPLFSEEGARYFAVFDK